VLTKFSLPVNKPGRAPSATIWEKVAVPWSELEVLTEALWLARMQKCSAASQRLTSSSDSEFLR
jgi:hypothetical protein